MEIRRRDGTVLFSVDGHWVDVGEENRRVLAGLDLRDAELRGQPLDEAVLEGTDLSGADLYEAFLFRTDFSRSRCAGTCFRGADLEEAKFVAADLRLADFSRDDIGRHTRLGGADFSGANLDGAIMTDALYDETTVFPPDFDARGRGMVTMDDLRARGRS